MQHAVHLQYLHVCMPRRVNDESVQAADGAGPHIPQKSVIEGIEGESAYVVMSNHC